MIITSGEVYMAKFRIYHEKKKKTLTGWTIKMIFKKQDRGMLKHMPLRKYSK